MVTFCRHFPSIFRENVAPVMHWKVLSSDIVCFIQESARLVLDLLKTIGRFSTVFPDDLPHDVYEV